MRFKKPALALLLIALAAIAAQHAAAGQTAEVTIRLEAANGAVVPFRAAFASSDGGLQIVDDMTPFERRIPGGFAIGIIESGVGGLDLQASISAGGSSSTHTGRRLIVGSNVMKGIETFIRAF